MKTSTCTFLTLLAYTCLAQVYAREINSTNPVSKLTAVKESIIEAAKSAINLTGLVEAVKPAVSETKDANVSAEVDDKTTTVVVTTPEASTELVQETTTTEATTETNEEKKTEKAGKIRKKRNPYEEVARKNGLKRLFSGMKKTFKRHPKSE